MSASFTVEGVQKTARVLFDRPYAAPFGMQADADSPSCQGATADLAGLQRDDAITVDGKPFEIDRAEPDGTGVTNLVLRSL
ncbi:Phage Head-Tail Attachment [compost metagenome]